MTLDTTQITTPEFPFYFTGYDEGLIKSCIKNADLSCQDCIAKSMCLVKDEL